MAGKSSKNDPATNKNTTAKLVAQRASRTTPTTESCGSDSSPFGSSSHASSPKEDQRELRSGFSMKQLSELCYRLATSLEAGIDVRRVWRSEAERATGRSQPVFTAIANSIEVGETLTAAITPWKGFFPRLFVAMISVGEATGTLGEVLRRLSQHYEHRAKVARNFRSQIAWPLLQLFAALTVVGLMILIGGVIETAPGKPLDLLGFGLTGTTGLITYISLLGVLIIGFFLLNGYMDRRPRVRDVWIEFWSKQPVVGPCLKKIALSRIAWALHLTLNVEMDLRRLAPLVLGISGNRYFAKYGPQVTDDITQGLPLSVAFTNTNIFPRDFLDALHVAEESGQIVESMARLSRQYEEEAESAMSTLTAVLAGVIWAGVAMMIVILIFRIFNFYTKTIYDALDGF